MFVARADVLLDLLHQNRPALHDGLQKIAAAWDGPDQDATLAEIWPTLEKVAIDYSVAEPAAVAGRVAVVPADLGWDDVGDFASLGGLLGAEGTVRVLGDPSQVLGWDADGVVVTSGDRLVVIVGLDDVVIVDTPDALLVTTQERAQDVKSIVEHLKRTGSTGLT
jgi:mannose-1-phosphate guanylyltransferase